ncbi:membrane-associated progesterone receptor component 1-like [Macrosteles quadrilineatus]|uniref:membrane-associated progesterone receptor component 1-like n=1 Tax=Macrosteles quadrilineatus TaxID=74068 RepID=UPI0023E1C6C5|nr:membrane-associated progesterone receptor component 1-like [Macrosteles quadrilineatus]
MAESKLPAERGGLLSSVFYEIISSPLNIGLVFVIAFLVYKIFKVRQGNDDNVTPAEKPLPKMKKRDFTIEELRKYDGTGEDGRVLVAVNGKVFDATRGKRFYGPGGPYAAFGGRDASRGLATFSVTGGSDTYDDLSDLSPMEMDSVREWEMQFTEKYDYVGRLLKPGEAPNSYSDEEDEPSATDVADKSKDD